VAVLASITTFAIEGVGSREVTVEVDVRRGLPAFTLVGLADRAIRESRERVRAAVLNSDLEFPMKRLTVNLAPAHLRKEGPSFDLAIAVGLLAASEQIPLAPLEGCAVSGELSLTGVLRPGRGALAAALGAHEAGYDRLIVPSENAAEAALVRGIEVFAVPSLRRIADLFHERWHPPPARRRRARRSAGPEELDLADVRGQDDAKRGLEIAAAGGHNLLMVGPPGTGKTMLARRLPGILPPPTFDEALEITRVQSVAGVGDGGLAIARPFRAPHHTISAQGLVGGGSTPRPGEVTLAHRGVLFLDELPEFSRSSLDALRQPLEEGRIEITRGQRTIAYPARATVVGACNPCPCARGAGCDCDALALGRYARRMSGPLLDRIDIVCEVRAVPPVELVRKETTGETSERVRERISVARKRQAARLKRTPATCNGDMDGRMTRRLVPVEGAAAPRLLAASRRDLITGRGYDRVLRVARTIADLEPAAHVRDHHIDEALGYRLSGSVLVAA
jgi:magnesium chelatase family protein